MIMKKGKPTWFYVDYNGKFIAMYKTLNGALRYIQRRGLKDDLDNSLYLVDNEGDMYNPLNGNPV